MTPEMPPGRPRKACELIFTAQSARKAILLIKLMENALEKPVGQEGRKAQSAGLPFTRHLFCLELMPQEGSSSSRLSIFDTLLVW